MASVPAAAAGAYRALPLCSRQVRTVTGFQPEGIHLTQWTQNSVLVSWQTGGG